MLEKLILSATITFVLNLFVSTNQPPGSGMHQGVELPQPESAIAGFQK
jgi:hypothetical protein